MNVLILEDDKNINNLLKSYLDKENFNTYQAYTGKECLDILKKNNIDIAILDVMLPDTDGFEICRKLRSHTNIPIIMLTAKDSSTDKVIGLGIGADDYITKPFNINEVIARVKAHIRRFYSFNQTNNHKFDEKRLLKFKNITINKNKYEVLIYN